MPRCAMARLWFLTVRSCTTFFQPSQHLPARLAPARAKCRLKAATCRAWFASMEVADLPKVCLASSSWNLTSESSLESLLSTLSATHQAMHCFSAVSPDLRNTRAELSSVLCRCILASLTMLCQPQKLDPMSCVFDSAICHCIKVLERELRASAFVAKLSFAQAERHSFCRPSRDVKMAFSTTASFNAFCTLSFLVRSTACCQAMKLRSRVAPKDFLSCRMTLALRSSWASASCLRIFSCSSSCFSFRSCSCLSRRVLAVVPRQSRTTSCSSSPSAFALRCSTRALDSSLACRCSTATQKACQAVTRS
mmetsp:Transcript_88618/g.159768  ORF Transcript_88618/g.159768 Transcript_88618/m.159768 type:complete len:308 (+) Transcript_88618:401-1324(+)